MARPHVMRLAFDDGTVRELQFLVGGHEGTVFASLDDPAFFAQVTVDPTSRTVVWPNGLDLDPAVLHGDFEPAGTPHFRNVTPAAEGTLAIERLGEPSGVEDVEFPIPRSDDRPEAPAFE